MPPSNDPIPLERITSRIYLFRGVKVMLDADLAELYGVTTSALNQAVSRNAERFPQDFMFRLTKEEVDTLKSQSVISKSGRGGRLRSHPQAFTENGVAMLSSVLRSDRAILVNIQIMRTFTQLREMLVSNEQLRRKVEAMERRYDGQFRIIFNAVKKLMAAPATKKRRIGFRPKD